MHIEQLSEITTNWNPDPIALWEENMHEPWVNYKNADMFVVRDDDTDDIIGGFAVYRDTSDGISGLFCSGWAGRHKNVPCGRILHLLADSVGDIYLKTRKRAAKILLEKVGERVKNTDRFGYYIIRGKKNG